MWPPDAPDVPDPPDPPGLTVMTFNIRYDDGSDGPLAWRPRREGVIATIRAHRPDLLAIQEPTDAQARDIADAMPGWTPFGPSGEEWDDLDPPRGFFRADRFAVRDTGVFWLSDTPEEPRSVSFANDYGARACAWVAMHDRVQRGPDGGRVDTAADPHTGGNVQRRRLIRCPMPAFQRRQPARCRLEPLPIAETRPGHLLGHRRQQLLFACVPDETVAGGG